MKRLADNFALQKVRIFHANDKIIENDMDAIGKPGTYTYISNIFKRFRELYEPYEGMKNVLIGGTGWNLSVRLPDEIDAIKPHSNMGFTSRGCNNTCYFCFVPQKEGKFHVVGNLKDLWDGTPDAGITLWDNNILQDLNHTKAIVDEAKELGVRLDFNQGIDFRLITQDVVDLLKPVRLIEGKKWRFALDNPGDIEKFRDQLPLIRQFEKTPFVYVYVNGKNEAGEFARLDFLREEKCKPNIQPDDCIYKTQNYEALASYCNRQHGSHFFKMDFDTFYPLNQAYEGHMVEHEGIFRVVDIDKIRIEEGRRAVGNVDNIVKNIEISKFNSPILLTLDNTVKSKHPHYILVAGAHRIKALLQMGRTKVPAMIFKYVTKRQREMAEIGENLFRSELSELERGIQTYRWKMLYEEDFPETKKSEKIKGHSKSIISSAVAFSEYLSDKTDVHRRVIENSAQIGANLAKNECDILSKTTLANNKTELLLLVRKTPEERAEFYSLLNAKMVKKVSEFNSMKNRAETDSQAVPEEPVEGIDFKQTASIWCGRYEDHTHLIPDNSIQCVLTDAPYDTKKAVWDNLDPIPLMQQISRILTSSGSALVFCSEKLLGIYLNNMAGLHLKQILHWYKTNKKPLPQTGRSKINRYADSIEYILWFVKDLNGYTFNPQKIVEEVFGSKMTSFFDENLLKTTQCSGGERFSGNPNINGKIKAMHECQKPVKLIESLVLAHSNRGDTIVDFFCGVGTIPEEATKWGRSFLGTELDPDYCDFARKRMVYFMANKYVLADEEFFDNDWDEYYDNDEVIRGEYEPEIKEEMQAEMTEEIRAELKAELKAEMKAKYILTMAQMQENCEAGTAPEALQAQYQAYIDAGFKSEDFKAKVESV